MKKKKYHSHYRKGNKAPTQENIHRFFEAITKYFKKKQRRAEKALDKLLSKYHIEGTLTEGYWKLKALNILIGKELYTQIPEIENYAKEHGKKKRKSKHHGNSNRR